jgi:hypothetical protein
MNMQRKLLPSQALCHQIGGEDPHLLDFSTNKGTQLIVTLQFGFDFAVWQWTLPWHPGKNIMCRHSTISLENAVLFSTFFTVSSYSRKVSHRQR